MELEIFLDLIIDKLSESSNKILFDMCGRVSSAIEMSQKKEQLNVITTLANIFNDIKKEMYPIGIVTDIDKSDKSLVEIKI